MSYSAPTWVLFVCVAFVAARLGGLAGVIVGNAAVAIAITALDLRWIQAVMHTPGWDGQPDQDFVFMIGVFLRILLINAVLLPVSFFGVRLKRRRAAGPVA